MANPSMVVRIAANLQELKQNLAEGRNQIEATTAGMQKLATSFRGDRLIQAAHNVAAAVQQIGGASRLTEAEQARVNRTVEKALDKYRLLGQQAPQALQDLAAQTHHATEKTSMLTRGVQLLIGAFSVRAIARAAGDALEFGGRMSDLAAKTGLTAEALQRMGFAAGQSGVPVDRLADGIVQLSKRLVEGDTSAVAAVSALGLNVQQLIAQGPERAFYAIGEAVAGVRNPMEQAAIATGLFGRTGADFLPAFKADMEGVAESAARAGLVLSEDTVAALDRADDSFAALKVSVTVLMGAALEPFLPLIADVAQWLGTAIPSSLAAARAGVDALIRSGLELKAWLLDMAVSIAQTVADVPVLGRVFGESSGDIDRMRQSAQAARDHLASFVAQGLRPAVEATAAAIGPMVGYGEALDSTGRKARAAAGDLHIITGHLDHITRFQIAGILHEGLVEFQTDTGNAAEAMQDLIDAMARAEGKATQIGPVLANSMTLPWVQAKASVEQTTPVVQGFFSKVFGGASQLGGDISGIFQAAFEGGGGALGAVKSFATKAVGGLLGMIPVVGPFVSQFAGPIVAMFGQLIGKAKEFFRTLFGGASQGERNDRSLVQDFEEQVIAALSAEQQAEAGGERWKQVVIAVRDAYLAAGLSAAEAERDVARLWESSREGGEESWRVVDEVNRKMQGASQAAVEGVEAIDRAIRDLPTAIDFEVRGRYHAPDLPREGYASGTMGVHGNWFRNFGPATTTVLHGREAVVTPQQAPAFARAVLGSSGESDAELKQLIRDLPRAMKLALREATVMA